MGRPGIINTRTGIRGNKQLSIVNLNADIVAIELAKKIKAYAGDAKYMKGNDPFLKNVSYRKDIDSDGYYDIIAHGSESAIIFNYKGKDYIMKAKTVAKMIQSDTNYKGQSIRLLSCNTGANPRGFAQTLANKLGVHVKAPNNILWSYNDRTGRMDVAPRKNIIPGTKGFDSPDFTKKGDFIIFYPKKGRKK